MIRALTRLFLMIAGLLAVVAIIGSLMPRDYEFEIERNVAVAPSLVFAKVNDLKSWPEWTEWDTSTKPFMTVTFGPVTTGENASLAWSDTRGDGKLWITDSQVDQQVSWKSRFGNFPEMTTTMTLEPSGTGTLVHWSSSGKLPGGPFYGYFRAIFREGMKREYLRNLEKLEAELLKTSQVEAGESSARDASPSVRDQ